MIFMTYEEFLQNCDNCIYCGERYFYGSTARFCGLKEKFCSDVRVSQDGQVCSEFLSVLNAIYGDKDEK